jgi:hypothetical protein
VKHNRLIVIVGILAAVAASPAFARGGGGGFGVGAVGGTTFPQWTPSVPSFQHDMPTPRPLFGPARPAPAPRVEEQRTLGTPSQPLRPSHPTYRRPHAGPGPAVDLRGHDVHHFTPAEHAVWSRGHWHHGWHHHRFGWWWFAGGFWYWYMTPDCPYPGFVSNDAEESSDQSASDDTDSSENSAMGCHCSSPPGYYPDVVDCAVPWVEAP